MAAGHLGQGAFPAHDPLDHGRRIEPLARQVARFVASQAIMLSLAGVPGIYVHSLIGSRSWRQGVEQTGRTRTINREKLDLMQVLAEETRDGSNIRVNSFATGPTRTHLRAHAYPGEDPKTVKPPEDLLPAYLWLMGPDSIGTTGQALDADSL